MVLLMFDSEKKKWNEITEEEAKELPEGEREDRVIYLDRKLKEKLDFAKEHQRRNNDVIGVIDGTEGSGKSSLGGNIMRYMSNDEFNPMEDMVGADYDDGIKKITETKKGGHLFFDEGNAFFLSTEIMKREQRDLHKVFSIFRQKNLFVLIALPSFFRLSSYFALDRSRFLIKTYLKDGDRGYFAYYGDKTKSRLYRYGRKDHNYECVAPNFRGRFTKCIRLESEEYDKFKLKTLTEALNPTKKVKQKTEWQIKQELTRQIIAQAQGIKAEDIAKVLGLSDRQVYKIKARLKEAKIQKE